MTQPLPVTGADREAAAAMMDAYRDRLTPDEQAESAMLARNIRAGLHDDAPRVLAFARHRLASTPSTGAVPEGMREWHGEDSAPADASDIVGILMRGGSFTGMRRDAVHWRYRTYIPEIGETMPADCDVIAYCSYATPAPVPATREGSVCVPDAAKSDAVEAGRKAVARCIEIARETREGFLSPDYATDQPSSSFNERFACDQVVDAIEREFGMGSNEQRRLLGKPTMGEEYRAALATPTAPSDQA